MDERAKRFIDVGRVGEVESGKEGLSYMRSHAVNRYIGCRI